MLCHHGAFHFLVVEPIARTNPCLSDQFFTTWNDSQAMDVLVETA